MAVTKQDIKDLLDTQTKTLRTEVKQGFQEQEKAFDKKLQKQTKAFDKKLAKTATKNDLATLGQLINRGFEDQKNLIENTYASKDELEELKNEMYELREKVETVDALREKVEALEQRIASA